MMMAKIIQLPGYTTLDLQADKVLENLIGKLDCFCLAGYDKDGKEFFSATFSDGHKMIWLMERFKQRVLEND